MFICVKRMIEVRTCGVPAWNTGCKLQSNDTVVFVFSRLHLICVFFHIKPPDDTAHSKSGSSQSQSAKYFFWFQARFHFHFIPSTILTNVWVTQSTLIVFLPLNGMDLTVRSTVTYCDAHKIIHRCLCKSIFQLQQRQMPRYCSTVALQEINQAMPEMHFLTSLHHL